MGPRRTRGRGRAAQDPRGPRAAGAEKDGVLAEARSAANTARFLDGKQVVKAIYVPGKLVNFVVR